MGVLPMQVGVEGAAGADKWALCIIDMQNDFCHVDGFLNQENIKRGRQGVDVQACLNIATTLQDVLQVVRPQGMPVVWVRSLYDYKYLKPAHIRQRKKEGLSLEGTWGADYFMLEPAPGELIVNKHTFSGFHGTDMHALLAQAGITGLLLAGVATNVCVESTLRDAFFHGYDVKLLEDCVCSSNAAGHAGTLATVRHNFGQVLTSRQWLEAATPKA